MKVNFDINANASNTLKAWGIYDVFFKGFEYIEGEKDGKKWQAMKIKFQGKEGGTFEPTVFCPGEKGMERVTGETMGKPWVLPSAMENLSFTLAYVANKLFKEVFDKNKDKLAVELPKDFKKLVEAMQKLAEAGKAIDKETKIKVVGNKKNYASLPNFINISKAGDCYISNDWIGNNIAFSAYELKKMKSQTEAAPTNMDTAVSDFKVDTTSEENNDLDFDVNLDV